MSAQLSPHISSMALDAATTRKRDRPPVLALDSSEKRAVSDGEVRYQQPNGNNDNNTRQVRKRIIFPAMGLY